MTQITTSPYTSDSATVTIPTTSGDNLINFAFDNEDYPFAQVFAVGYDAATEEQYNWTQYDAKGEGMWDGTATAIITGLTQSTTSAPGSGLYSSTDYEDDFSNASYQIDLAQTFTGASNGSTGGFGAQVIYGHGYIFFIFPG